MKICAYATGGPEEIVETEGLAALCNDCCAIIICETREELWALVTSETCCPGCGGTEVCCCCHCIRGGHT